jgi:predicted Zn-dependent protease
MRLAAFSLLTISFLALPGCGGAGGVTQALPLCGLDFSTPNYAADSDRNGSPNLLLRWANFPVRVHFAQTVTYTQNGAFIVSNEQVREGFRRWEGASGGGVSWSETGSIGDADIIVRTIPLDRRPGPNKALGTTTVQYFASNRQIIEAEIRLFTWPNMTVEQFRDGLLSTATHEVGHALYLLGHSPHSSDLMYAVGSVNADKGVSERDANTLRTSYCGAYYNGRAPLAAPLMGEAPQQKTISCPGHDHDH